MYFEVGFSNEEKKVEVNVTDKLAEGVGAAAVAAAIASAVQKQIAGKIQEYRWFCPGALQQGGKMVLAVKMETSSF